MIKKNYTYEELQVGGIYNYSDSNRDIENLPVEIVRKTPNGIMCVRLIKNTGKKKAGMEWTPNKIDVYMKIAKFTD